MKKILINEFPNHIQKSYKRMLKITRELSSLYTEYDRIKNLLNVTSADISNDTEKLEKFFSIVMEAIQITDHAKGFSELAIRFLSVINSTEEYPVLEIGTRRGGSASLFLKVLAFIKKHRFLITVDPYANFEFWNDKDDRSLPGHRITMVDYREAMKTLSDIAFVTETNWVHFLATDMEWFNNVINSIPLPSAGGTRKKIDFFSFVYLDGPHQSDLLKRQISLLSKKICKGGCIVVDDAHLFENIDDIAESASGFTNAEVEGERLYLKR